MIITGNREFGLAKALYHIYPDAIFVSRASGFDLTNKSVQTLVANKATEHEIIINCAALYGFNQTVLLHTIYKSLQSSKNYHHIINIGSTTDRVKKGGSWLYNAEKKALRDYSNTLGINGVWSGGPKITYISFGTLENNQDKHPDRTTMSLSLAANYVQWVINQPKEISINEISIDPIQIATNN